MNVNTCRFLLSSGFQNEGKRKRDKCENKRGREKKKRKIAQGDIFVGWRKCLTVKKRDQSFYFIKNSKGHLKCKSTSTGDHLWQSLQGERQQDGKKKKIQMRIKSTLIFTGKTMAQN